jgi:hypothetical protein
MDKGKVVYIPHSVSQKEESEKGKAMYTNTNNDQFWVLEAFISVRSISVP